MKPRPDSQRDSSILRFRLGPSGELRRVPFVPRKKRANDLATETCYLEPESALFIPTSDISSTCALQEVPTQDISNVAIEYPAIPDLQQYFTLQSFIQGSSDVFCLQKRLRNQEPSSMQDVQKTWIALALQDSAFFHAALSHYIGIEELDEREGDPVKALEHRMRALSVVNERLRSPQIATCNATIATVASICAYEASNGSLEAVMAHVKGLEYLVRLKGGFHEAEIFEPLKRLIAWADLEAAFALSVAPTIVPFEDPNVHGLESRSLQFDFVQCRDQLDDILVMLKALTGEISVGFRTAQQHGAYNQGVYTAYRSLLYLLQRPQSTQNCFERLICFAAAIYSVGCLRDVGSHARIVQDLVARLKHATTLNGTALSSVTVAGARKLTWALFCGGVAASQAGDRAFFARQLVPLCSRLDLHSWKDASGILHSLAWSDSWGKSHQQFWQEITWAQK